MESSSLWHDLGVNYYHQYQEKKDQKIAQKALQVGWTLNITFDVIKFGHFRVNIAESVGNMGYSSHLHKHHSQEKSVIDFCTKFQML